MSVSVRGVEQEVATGSIESSSAAIADFQDPRQEWRRLLSEFYGTFLLVLAAAGGGMMGQAFPDTISRTAAVVAPGLTVMGVIMFMGKISGAHLNPAVSIAFSLRGDFPWRRVPGYIVVQLVGATLAAVPARGRSTSPPRTARTTRRRIFGGAAFLMEAVLTLGLVSVILGTASGAQNVGMFGAFGVGGYIALAGLWGSPISGASMNPGTNVRTGSGRRAISPSYWVYVAGPLRGAALAVGIAYVLRGPGGGRSGSAAAQGDLDTVARRPDQA